MSVFAEIKARLSLPDVIAEYVEIYPAGAYYKCLCPFHGEKTPSLMISPEKGIWHCFGCGAGGDVFQFVQDYENLDLKETLQRLAQKAGVSLQTTPQSPAKAAAAAARENYLARGRQYLAWSQRVYQQILSRLLQDRTHPVARYCLARGLSQTTLEEFGFGFAPPGNALLTLARKHGLDLALLEAVGLLKKRANGSLRDRFVNRLLLPIFSEEGSCVGFTGRVLAQTPKRPKYLNSPATPWFDKSTLWFALERAKPAIRRTKTVLVVEGHLDVVAAHAAGWTHTIAAQGTAVSQTQLARLKKLGAKVLLAFDNDAAGAAAGERFLQGALGLGLEVDAVLLPAAFKDLDAYLHDHPHTPPPLPSTPYFTHLLARHRPSLQSLDVVQKEKSVRRLAGLLQDAPALTQKIALQALAKTAELPETALTTLLTPPKAPPTLTPESTRTAPKATRYPALLLAFEGLVRLDYPETLLGDLYFLLAPFFPEFREPQFREFATRLRAELTLASPAQNPAPAPDRGPALLASLLSFLDQRFTTFVRDPERRLRWSRLRQTTSVDNPSTTP